MRYSLLCTIGWAILLMLFLLSLSVGAVSLDLKQNFLALFGQGNSQVVFIVQQLRLPRTLLCLLIGAILAICGSVLQGLFRNPLADPSVIGVSAGAALGAGIAIVLIPSGLFFWQSHLIAIFAFIGGLVATLFVYKIGRSEFGSDVKLMLLSGIAIGSLAFAFLGILQFIADDSALRELSMWQLGSLSQANSYNITLCTMVFILIYWRFSHLAQALNALLLGDLEARHLGINIEKVKYHCIIFTALAIGIAVASAGIIGFIGLVIPHICRTLLGANHRTLIPTSALLGAIILLTADILARIIAPPAEIPIGILTALLGAPFFIYLLIKSKQQG